MPVDDLSLDPSWIALCAIATFVLWAIFGLAARNRLAALLVSCLGALTSVVLFALSNTGSSNSATRWVVGAGIAVVVVAVGAEALFGRRAGPNGSPHPIAAIASTLPLFVPLAALAAFPGNTSGSGSPGGSSVLAYVAIGFWLLVLLFLIAGTDMLNWRPVSNPVAQTGGGSRRDPFVRQPLPSDGRRRTGQMLPPDAAPVGGGELTNPTPRSGARRMQEPALPAQRPDAGVAGSLGGLADELAGTEPEYPVFSGTPGKINDQMGSQTFPFVPARQFDGAEVGRLSLRAASHIGANHQHSGIAREDDYAFARTDDEQFVVATVADGLGAAQARFSHMGAYWASRFVTRRLIAHYEEHRNWDIEPTDVAAKVSQQIMKTAGILVGDDTPELYSTTFVSLIGRVEDATFFAFRVGDPTVMIGVDGCWHDIFGSGGDDGTLVSTATDVIPSNNPKAARRIWDKPVVNAPVLLMSDGLSTVLERDGAASRELLTALAQPPRTLDFMRILGFRERGAHDDRTAIGLWWG